MSHHNAPSVTYPLGRSHCQAWVLTALWSTAALAVGIWIFGSPYVGWRHGAAALALAGAAAVAIGGWKNTAVGQLSWDAQVWRWEGPGYQAGLAEYELVVAADFKNVMLLRIENQANARLWLWAERSAFPSRWLDLRRAVYSPHRASDVVVSPS